MLKIGLTGGIGTGKSYVSSLFNKWGAYILDADSIAKNIINHNETAQSELIAEFGTDVMGANNKIELSQSVVKKKKRNVVTIYRSTQNTIEKTYVDIKIHWYI